MITPRAFHLHKRSRVMPRPRRFFCDGLTHHVIQRGNNRCAMFRDPAEYRLFLAYLRDAARQHRVAMHGFVLMTTHVHLLATPKTPTGLPKVMQDIGRLYVPLFNKRHERTGGLWEGRYKPLPIDSERYFLACLRYIESPGGGAIRIGV